MSRALRNVLILVLAAGLASGVYWVMQPKTGPDQRSITTTEAGRSGNSGVASGRRGARMGRVDGAVPVLAEVAQRVDLPIMLDGIGTARPLNTVTVRPQIDGKIIDIRFTDGQNVKAGDVLATLDDTTHRAARDQAVARRLLTEAQLANARRDLARYEGVARGVVAPKTIDTQTAQVRQLEAQLKADDAAVASAKAVLAYSEVRAPIDGRAGFRLVDAGNFVRAADPTGLVVITQVRPMSVQFTLPQQQLPAVAAALARGKVPVTAHTSGRGEWIDVGTLSAIDNQIDQSTGTVRLRAEFSNADMQLWPGQFVNVRLEVERRQNVLTVPVAAVQRGPSGTFVYVINSESVATVRPVAVSLQTAEAAVIAEGIAAGDRVITTGFSRLRDGSAVTLPDGAVVPSREDRRNDNDNRRRRDPQAKRDGHTAVQEGAARGANGGDGGAGSERKPRSRPAGRSVTDAIDAASTTANPNVPPPQGLTR